MNPETKPSNVIEEIRELVHEQIIEIIMNGASRSKYDWTPVRQKWTDLGNKLDRIFLHND